MTDAIAGFDEDADAGGGASAGTDDAYFVIDQLDFTEGGEGGKEGFTEGGIESVDGTVSLGGSFAKFFAHADGNRGAAGFPSGGAGADHLDFIGVDLEGGGDFLEGASNEEFERGVGGLKFITIFLKFFDFGEDGAGGGRFFFDGDTEFAGFHHDVGSAREFADEDALTITDRGWLDVFETGGKFIDRIDVHAAFVGEGGTTDEGGTGIVVEVGEFVDKAGKFGELAEIAIGQDFFAEFEFKKREKGGEITVSGAFSVAVHGALDLKGAFLDGGDGIGDT